MDQSVRPRSVLTAVSVFSFFAFFISLSFGHEVGEPELEKTQIWQKCCGGGDCVPKPVKIVNEGSRENQLVVRIDGTEAAVEKDKFSPVPSDRTWVCYIDPNGPVANENIRCVLYPEKGGTT